MKLPLVLLALLPHARCAQQAMDPAELQSALQSEPLAAWIDSIAARRNLSTRAVRSNVQAMTYRLDAVHEHSGCPGGGDGSGGEHARLAPRQPTGRDYPNVFGNEAENDAVTNARILSLHVQCREAFPDPPGCPFVPNHGVPSFWRATGGSCRGKTRRTVCRLPDDFGPPHWGQFRVSHETTHVCEGESECTRFRAFNFGFERAVQFTDCTSEKQTDHTEMVHNVPTYFQKYGCPMSPGTIREWDGYGESFDLRNIDWTLFTGVEQEPLSVSQSPTFLFGKRVQWRGRDPDYEPWLKFARVGSPATIRLYSHVV